jgi:predicted Zn-dependent peptidase
MALLQGISHYLEHMLFMGSEKYPDENEYDSYLSEHGGASNAFTELVTFLHLHRARGVDRVVQYWF